MAIAATYYGCLSIGLTWMVPPPPAADYLFIHIDGLDLITRAIRTRTCARLDDALYFPMERDSIRSIFRKWFQKELWRGDLAYIRNTHPTDRRFPDPTKGKGDCPAWQKGWQIFSAMTCYKWVWTFYQTDGKGPARGRWKINLVNIHTVRKGGWVPSSAFELSA